MLNVSPVSHHPLQTGQFGALAPPGPGPVRLTPRHSEGWSTAALLHYPLYEAGVQTVGHRVDIALTLNVISPGQKEALTTSPVSLPGCSGAAESRPL